MSLHPCPSCARHVRAGSTTCPFCKSALPSSHAPSEPVRRVARMAFVVATAVSCGKTTAPEPATEDATVAVTLYGAPPQPAPDAEAVAAAYGAAPIMANDASTPPVDAGTKPKKK